MKKYFLVAISILALMGIIFYITLIGRSEIKTELKKIEINNISFFMTRDAVERMYGGGRDRTPGCFGCEMNFIYPELKLSGRYSDTLDQDKGNRKSPKVKQITTINPAVKVFDIRVGDTFKDARSVLEAKGFKLQEVMDEHFYQYYYKDNVYIRLWIEEELYPLKRNRQVLGEDHESVGAISIEFRVHKDEEIYY